MSAVSKPSATRSCGRRRDVATLRYMRKPLPRYRAHRGSVGRVGRFVRQMVEGPLGFFLKYASHGQNVIEELDRRAVVDSCDFIEQHMPRTQALRTREDLWTMAIRSLAPTGLVLEFGVLDGYSTNYFARHLNRPVYGFDSFAGLQEDWAGTAAPKGSFDRGGKLPRVRNNVTLIKGWFDETVHVFLCAHSEPIAFIHFDCDTYDATKLVLAACGSRIVPGSLIIFDEHHGFRGWREGECKAWAEFVAERELRFEYLAFNRYSSLVRVTD